MELIKAFWNCIKFGNWNYKFLIILIIINLILMFCGFIYHDALLFGFNTVAVFINIGVIYEKFK